MFDTPTTSLPLHRDGKLKIVAAGTSERIRELPDVPTVAESGVPGFRSVTWYAMVAPPQTPAVLADKINRDVDEILGRRGLRREGARHSDGAGHQEPRGGGEILRRGNRALGKVIKQAGIPPQ